MVTPANPKRRYTAGREAAYLARQRRLAIKRAHRCRRETQDGAIIVTR
jgi:hypothetical protein